MAVKKAGAAANRSAAARGAGNRGKEAAVKAAKVALPKTAAGKTAEVLKRKPKKSAQRKMLIGMAALLVALIAVACVVMLPQQDKPPQIPEQVEAIRVYSQECGTCAGMNFLELVLASNGIDLNVRAVEASSEEGRLLAWRYGISSVPTLLIKPETVLAGSSIVNEGKQVFLKKLLEPNIVGDMYVVDATGVAEQMRAMAPPAAIMYLNAPEEGCTASGKPKVALFTEPYCATCIASSAGLVLALKMFRGEVEFEYRYFPAYAQRMYERFGQRDTDYAARYLACAAEQGLLADFQKEFNDMYCDKDMDGNATESEIMLCHVANPKLGQPLSQDELDTVAINAKIDRSILSRCLSSIDYSLGRGVESAHYYAISGKTALPIAVVDCGVVVPAERLTETLCAAHPELGGCER